MDVSSVVHHVPTSGLGRRAYKRQVLRARTAEGLKVDDEYFHIDRILKRWKRSDGRVEYLVSRKGYPSKFNSWVFRSGETVKMSRFVLTLPSNSSMDHFPHNTAARYTTKLVETLELEGAWEVGLLKIQSKNQSKHISIAPYVATNQRRMWQLELG